MIFSGRRTALSAFLYLGLVSATARDFSLYPTNSQSCLYAAADSSACDTSTVPKFNACVCSNGGGFLESAASCLGQKDSSEVGTVYSTMSTNCGNSNTPIAYSLAKWDQVASSGSSTSSAGTKSAAGTVVSTAKASTIVQTVVAPTATGTAAVVVTVTQAPASGQSSGVVSLVTLTPGQTTQLVSVVTYTPTSTGTGTAASQTSTGTSTPLPSSSSKIGTGVIVGAAVGAVVIIALLALVLFLFLRNRKNRRDNDANAAAAPLTGPSGPPPEAFAAAPEKYYQQPAVQQVHQYPSPTPSPAPMYSEQPKYNNGYQPVQQNPQPAYQAYNNQSAVSVNAPYGAAYAPPPPQGGAVELAGRPGAPTWAHEMPTHQ